ncbi:MAG: hypothetical protein Q7R33_00870 [Nitrosarchaeum sp.]|nr:hypothetical protein [Nitrosarchaeum sp.]
MIKKNVIKMSKICNGCNQQFETVNKAKRYCSDDCKSAYMLTNEYFEKRKNNKIAVMNKPDVKAKQIKSIRAALNTPEMHEKLSAACKIAQNKPEVKKKIKDKLTEFYSDENKKNKVCKKCSDRMKAIWNNKDSRERQSNLFREAYKNPEVIDKLSKSKLEFWKNEENADRMFMSKYKDYKLPSGLIVKVQGYEDTAIALLLQDFQESDLVIGTKNIGKTIDKILYQMNSKIRRYYPDIFIKSQNKVIEVKSRWSYNLHKEQNELKRLACINKGFNFEFMIFTFCKGKGLIRLYENTEDMKNGFRKQKDKETI